MEVDFTDDEGSVVDYMDVDTSAVAGDVLRVRVERFGKSRTALVDMTLRLYIFVDMKELLEKSEADKAVLLGACRYHLSTIHSA